MNNVILLGRLARDPNVRYTPSQLCVARFTVAVDRPPRANDSGSNEASADFISCVAFGKTGEFIEKYFTKGKLISLQGRIQTGSYTNKDGVKVYTTDVVAERVEFVGSKSESGGNSGGSYGGGNGSYGGNGDGDFGNDSNGGIPGGFDTLDDDDLPF